MADWPGMCPTFSLFLAARLPSSAPSAMAFVTPSSSPSLAVEMLVTPAVLPVSRLNSLLSARLRRSLNCVLKASTTCSQRVHDIALFHLITT